MKTLQYAIYTLFLFILLSLTGCNKELEDIDGETLIEQYQLSGRYKIQITPKMMGIAAITTGAHDAILTHEGGDVLRLKFTGFQKSPMPFKMSVDILMRIKPGPKGSLRIENIGGDFDADLPEGASVINQDDLPPGMEIPEDALVNGLHSNGDSFIAGVYEKMETPTGEKLLNFNWNLDPNVGLPVVINIKTIKKME
ncbi:MAG: hypothetical protein COB98_11005 [Flavobacteriaceae bacterium]|nr:MAG: hypothetical protein COB98_11005 [Flavobacteriaceae bacterium]